eukprot:TRINITY_DN69075_c0_g2_i1.p1 TRINITY_DN69075_c0_g2~~TRINITY_DN69075_c0_g2_i1.p1  ORF type:complete len:284 (+),score=28.92 TRINITY_DN69075_c0_g2_i1:71-853(+)
MTASQIPHPPAPPKSSQDDILFSSKVKLQTGGAKNIHQKKTKSQEWCLLRRPGHDWSGPGYSEEFIENEETCANLCLFDSRCYCAVWLSAEARCRLNEGIWDTSFKAPDTLDNVASIKVPCHTLSRAIRPEGLPTAGCFVRNTETIGEDIPDENNTSPSNSSASVVEDVFSPGICQRICKDRSPCTNFNYFEKLHRCVLKVQPDKSAIKEVPDIVTGPAECSSASDEEYESTQDDKVDDAIETSNGPRYLLRKTWDDDDA